MTGSATVLMIVSILIIWGGLIASATSLVLRGRREAREARDAASSQAHAHLRQTTS